MHPDDPMIQKISSLVKKTSEENRKEVNNNMTDKSNACGCGTNKGGSKDCSESSTKKSHRSIKRDASTGQFMSTKRDGTKGKH